MDAFDLRFAAPLWLLLLPPAWLLCWRLGRSGHARSAWRRLCDARLLQLIGVVAEGAHVRRWLAWPLALLFSLGLLAAAGPGWRPADGAAMQSAAARVLALDLSRSMLVRDIEPSRYAHARAAAVEIIESGFDGETGLVVYAGAVFTVAPLTRDAGTLRAFLDALRPGIVPVDGARIDLAVARAAELLDASITGRGQILVLAAGVERQAAAIEAARRAHAAGHRVSLMAFGTAAGGPRVAPDGALERDRDGAYRLARTDLAALGRIAAAGGGDFASIAASGGAWQLDTAIEAQDLVESDAGLADAAATPANEGYWLAWLMLPALLLLFRRNLLYGLLLALLLAPPAEVAAADWEHPWRHADRLAWQAWTDGEYRQAGELAAAPLLRGAAFYRHGDLPRALQAFAELDSAAAHYNRGNTLVRLQRHGEAIGAYRLALERQPGHRAARYNLRLARLFLELQHPSSGQNPGDPADMEPGLDRPRDSDRFGADLPPLENGDDAPRVGGGDGASMPGGRYDPRDDDGGRESPPTRLDPGKSGAADALAEVEQWIRELPASATELFERKFLRDYRRAQRGDR